MNQDNMNSFFEYNDEYPTCDSTYASLCIYLPRDFNPAIVSEKLGLQPTRTQVHGEVRNGDMKKWPTAWFLETSEIIQSKESRRHIDWILEQVEDHSEGIKFLHDIGAEIHISCYWVSALGHGGPMLDAKSLERIATLNIGICFDIYFSDGAIKNFYR
jgi:hypothetical protein